MDYREIKQRFLDYFKRRSHEIVPSSSLIPRDDPTLLFTNAGMVQFKGLFLGEEQRGYVRAATSQKCVRAGGKHNDLENIGYTARHHTFFEMLGNFSFGDYFKVQAISWAWELLTEGYKLPVGRLWVSVYKNDDDARRIWEEEIGVPMERIVPLGEKDNFWAMGDTGPCGPCSEIYIDQGKALGCGKEGCSVGCDCDRYLEIWNLVFTQFDRDTEGNLSPLPKPNIDTGMGLERLAAVVQGVTSNYDIDLFRDIIGRIEELSGKNYGDDQTQSVSFRVIADHARAVAFLTGDGVMPSNEGRGYVLRRIIRRAIRSGQVLGIKEPFLNHVINKVMDIMSCDYPELLYSKTYIEGVVANEEKRFADTLYYGLKILKDTVDEIKEAGNHSIPGDLVFKLYDTYGLSADIVGDVAREEGLEMDMPGYKKAMTTQRNRSLESWKGSGEEAVPAACRELKAKGVSSWFTGYRELNSKAKVLAVLVDEKESPLTGAGKDVQVVLDSTPFYGESGGQVGDTGWLVSDGMKLRVTNTLKFGQDFIVHHGTVEEGAIALGDEIEAGVDESRRRATSLNHTATHLLHAALRNVLGGHVKQAGSFVSPERLRFDFSHFTHIGQERLREVETLVNSHIRENLPVSSEEISMEKALETGAMAIFEERYGDTVRLVTIGDGVSMELCGGTHTIRTGDIAVFKILSESAVGANVRRIEALTGEKALEHIQEQDIKLKTIESLLKTSSDQLKEKVERILKEQKEKEREIESLKTKLRSRESGDILSGIREINGIKVLAREVKVDSPKDLREFADRIRDKFDSGIIILGAGKEEKVMLICVVTKDLAGRYRAGQIMSRLSRIVGGKGGGRDDMAQGGGSKPEELGRALEYSYELIKEAY